MLVSIGELSQSTLRWVPICQGFSHFLDFLHHFVMPKWATYSIRVNQGITLQAISIWRFASLILYYTINFLLFILTEVRIANIIKIWPITILWSIDFTIWKQQWQFTIVDHVLSNISHFHAKPLQIDNLSFVDTFTTIDIKFQPNL